MSRSPGGGTPVGDSRAQVKQACTVLYNVLPPLDARGLQAALWQPVGNTIVEWAKGGAGGAPLTAGIVQFGPHTITMVAINAPVSQEIMARTVAVSPMPPDRRSELENHRATIRLLYVGEASEPLGQMTALYTVAAALLRQGGLGILNERAALAQPTELAETYLAQLGTATPPLSLWVGAITFAQHEEGQPEQYLMRTYGMEQFDLPEVGTLFTDRARADDIYYLLMNVALYMVEGGPSLQIGAGDRADFLKRTYLITTPNQQAAEFQAPGGLFLLVEV